MNLESTIQVTESIIHDAVLKGQTLYMYETQVKNPMKTFILTITKNTLKNEHLQVTANERMEIINTAVLSDIEF